MSENIFVAGGAGFIGSHLVEKLIEMKNSVMVYDNFDSYYLNKERNIKHLAQNDLFTLINADILDFKKLLMATKGIDIIFHLAAQPGVRFSLENPVKTSKYHIVSCFHCSYEKSLKWYPILVMPQHE